MSDRAANIHGTLKGSFLPNAVAAWESDELRPWIIVNETEHSLGIYQAATVSQKGSAGSTRVEIEAYDRCWRVYTQKTETILHLAAGSSYHTEIRKLLTACGISLVIATPNRRCAGDRPRRLADWNELSDNRERAAVRDQLRKPLV